MFSDKLQRSLKKYPKWSEPLRKIGAQLESKQPGTAVDPSVVAARTGIPLGDVIAFLGLLSEESVGHLELQVVDERGLPVATYASQGELPATVEDQFGREIPVDVDNVDVVFRLTAA